MGAVLRKFILPIIAILYSSPALSFGNDESWTSGWGMGISEAIINKGPGNSIYVTCGTPTPERPVSGVSFNLIGDSSKDRSILLTFDGESPQDFSLNDGKIESFSRSGSAQFEYVIQKLKNKQWVNVRFQNGTNATFTLNGANDAIGDCPSDFSQ